MTDGKSDTAPPAKQSKPKAHKKKDPPSSSASASSSSVRKSPAEWMAYTRSYSTGPRIGKRPRLKIPSWQHGAAAALHGWAQHAHDENAPIQLSEADYKGALEAVEGIPPYKPHKGALSKHCGHKFEG